MKVKLLKKIIAKLPDELDIYVCLPKLKQDHMYNISGVYVIDKTHAYGTMFSPKYLEIGIGNKFHW
jgi:hypothetical protein